MITHLLVLSQVRTKPFENLKGYHLEAESDNLLGYKKKGVRLQFKVPLGLGFSLGFGRHNLSMASSMPPLGRAS
jgi:hypothetical protein